MTGKRANANPTKAFFVRMLTRDISLDDCILDLVDNSIDGAWKASGQKPSTETGDSSLAGYRVDIKISETEFRISDNCGGITLDDAANYAFTFGRLEDQETNDFSVGVYGIGMKRAVFKLGRDIRVSSTFEGEKGLEGFVVPINVGEWLGVTEGPWDFELDDLDPAEEPGVTISVKALLAEATHKFNDETYVSDLRRIMARDYMVPLMHGLSITVNDKPVDGWKLHLLQNQSFKPMRELYDDDGVSVEIFAGMASPPPDNADPDEGDTDADPSGWYVLCNGRVVLAADTSSITGWGVDLPKWHRQYKGFAGIVHFTSDEPVRLPMTTTKRNVDVSSAVFQRAVARMYAPTRAWIDYANARKQGPESAREHEEDTKPVQAFEVVPRADFKLPTPNKSNSLEKLVSIQYQVPVKHVKALGSALGNVRMSARDVGLKAFEFAYDEMVDEG